MTYARGGVKGGERMSGAIPLVPGGAAPVGASATAGIARTSRGASLKRDAAWTAVDTLVSAGLAFAFRLVMARFLVPAEFGVFAMALTTFAIVQVINDFGMSATVIQRPVETFTDEVVDTAFAASTMVSVLLFVVNLAVIAPVSAWVYDSARVGLVTAVIGVSFLFTPTVSIARALLFRARDYRAVTIARIASTVASIVLAALVLAVFRNVWALVVQVVAGQVLLAVGMYFVGSWRPRLHFASGAFREMIGYSGLVFANDAYTALSKNFDIIVIGRLLSQSEVGLYSLAFYITDIVRLNLASILNRVMFTQYAALQNDLSAVRANVLRTLSWNALMIIPLMIAIILAGPLLTPVFLGDAWRNMGPTLQLLALSVILSALGGTTSTVFKALGRPGLEFTIAIAMSTMVLVPTLIVGVRYAGIAGAAAAVCFRVFVSVLVRQLVLDTLVGSTFRGFLATALGSLLVQVPIVGVWLLGMHFLPFDPIVRAIGSLVLGFSVYGGILMLVRRTNDAAWPAFDTRTFASHHPATVAGAMR